MFLLAVSAFASDQTATHPHNAVTCERCHSVPAKLGSSGMTVQRIGSSFEGKFIPASEGGIHHRNGESAQSIISPKPIKGERVSLNLLGDGYIEAIDGRDIEQNAQRQRQANSGIVGALVTAPVFEATGLSAKMQIGPSAGRASTAA